MGKKSKKSKSTKVFFILDDESEEYRKVNPDKKRFDGTQGEHRLDHPVTILGHTYAPGVYPFVFWDKNIYDKDDNPIKEQPAEVPTEPVVVDDVDTSSAQRTTEHVDTDVAAPASESTVADSSSPDSSSSSD